MHQCSADWESKDKANGPNIIPTIHTQHEPSDQFIIDLLPYWQRALSQIWDSFNTSTQKRPTARMPAKILCGRNGTLIGFLLQPHLLTSHHVIGSYATSVALHKSYVFNNFSTPQCEAVCRENIFPNFTKSGICTLASCGEMQQQHRMIPQGYSAHQCDTQYR